MKIKFWKYKYSLVTTILVLGLTILIIVFVGIFTNNETAKIPLIICPCVILLFGLIILLSQEGKYISKIIFSKEGMEIITFNKRKMFMAWEEITQVKATPYGKGGRYLSFVADGKQIDVEITKKMYITIMLLCRYEKVKIMLNNEENFQLLFERYNKKIK